MQFSSHHSPAQRVFARHSGDRVHGELHKRRAGASSQRPVFPAAAVLREEVARCEAAGRKK